MMVGQPIERWEGASAAELERQWEVPAVRLYDSVGSTNDVARELAEAGAQAGTVVLAEEQVAGRGRRGRGWESAAGLGVWLSVVVRAAGTDPLLLPLLVGARSAAGLDRFVRPANVQIKWPNDLLLEGRKVAGILCEAAWVSGRLSFAVVGVGINVGHLPDDFPPDLRSRATSIRIVSGWSPSRLDVAGVVAGAVLAAFREAAGGRLSSETLRQIESRDALRGRQVSVGLPGTAAPVEGTAMGVAQDGALLVRTGEASLRAIRSGTIECVTAPASDPSPSSAARGGVT